MRDLLFRAAAIQIALLMRQLPRHRVVSSAQRDDASQIAELPRFGGGLKIGVDAADLLRKRGAPTASQWQCLKGWLGHTALNEMSPS